MKILVLGGGWLGEMFRKQWGAGTYGPHLINGDNDIPGVIWNQYDVIVNTVAKTNIDWCEANKVESFHINTIIASNLARRCYLTGKKYVFFSSACIFESNSPTDIKNEYSKPNPQCFYALTKYVAEELIQEINPEALIIRLRLPISEAPHPRNTLDKLLKYPYLNNEQETMTIVEDMIQPLTELITEQKTGIYHLLNAGTASPSEWGQALGHTFTETTKAEQDLRLKYEGKAKRVTTYATSTKIPLLPDIQKRLPEVVSKYKEACAF